MKDSEILFMAWNIAVCFIYGIDKFCARRGKRRIRENTLIASAFFLGGVGAMFGMVLFNHKTSKMKFRIIVPFCAVITVFVLVYLFRFYM